jgi:hypothetical protein
MVKNRLYSAAKQRYEPLSLKPAAFDGRVNHSSGMERKRGTLRKPAVREDSEVEVVKLRLLQRDFLPRLGARLAKLN